MADYSQALRRLASLTGLNQRAVLMGEAGIILKTWAGRVKVVTQEQADKNTWLHILGEEGLGVTRAPKPGDVSVNAGIRGGNFGRVWVRSKEPRHRDARGKPYRLAGVISEYGQNFRPMNFHWKNQTWSDIQEIVESIAIQARRKLVKGRKAIGLARQSVVQIADALGIDLLKVKGGGTLSAAGIAKARAAIAVTGRAYKNGLGSALGDDEKAVVTLINNLPFGVKIGMDRQLLGIINGRKKFFQQSYAKGAFDTMTRTARAYPWLRVTPPPGAN